MKLSFRISSAKEIFLEKKKLLGLGFDLEQKKITETHTVFFSGLEELILLNVHIT